MNQRKQKKDKRGFTMEQCGKGGSAVRGGECFEAANAVGRLRN